MLFGIDDFEEFVYYFLADYVVFVFDSLFVFVDYFCFVFFVYFDEYKNCYEDVVWFEVCDDLRDIIFFCQVFLVFYFDYCGDVIRGYEVLKDCVLFEEYFNGWWGQFVDGVYFEVFKFFLGGDVEYFGCWSGCCFKVW